MIAIVDYGAGNLHSVKKAFDFLGFKCFLAGSAGDLEGSAGLVLPGVGAFGSAVSSLKESGLFEPVRQWISDGKPFLGICLGMQLLMDGSDESPDSQGFSVAAGGCSKFSSGKVPQIGWNSINIRPGTGLFKGIENGSHFYFLHSYYTCPHEKALEIASADYGISYTCALKINNAHAVQFHPEKSGKAGLALLSNWAELC